MHAAAYPNLLIAGSTCGMLLANAPVSFLGAAFADHLPLKALQRARIVVFMALGILFIVRGLYSKLLAFRKWLAKVLPAVVAPDDLASGDAEVKVIHKTREVCMLQQFNNGSNAQGGGTSVKEHYGEARREIARDVDYPVGPYGMTVQGFGPLLGHGVTILSGDAIVGLRSHQALSEQFNQGQVPGLVSVWPRPLD